MCEREKMRVCPDMNQSPQAIKGSLAPSLVNNNEDYKLGEKGQRKR